MLIQKKVQLKPGLTGGKGTHIPVSVHSIMPVLLMTIPSVPMATTLPKKKSSQKPMIILTNA